MACKCASVQILQGKVLASLGRRKRARTPGFVVRVRSSTSVHHESSVFHAGFAAGRRVRSFLAAFRTTRRNRRIPTVSICLGPLRCFGFWTPSSRRHRHVAIIMSSSSQSSSSSSSSPPQQHHLAIVMSRSPYRHRSSPSPPPRLHPSSKLSSEVLNIK